MDKKHYIFLILFFFPLICAQPITRPNRPINLGIPCDNNRRISSYPYITGDTIRAACDWIIDETVSTFDPEVICDGDIVFLNADWHIFFFETIHPQIKSPYILVTHNTLFHAPGKYEKLLDDPKLIAWFAKNTMIAHPKIHPLPLGMANKYWSHGNTNVMDEVCKQLDTLKKKTLLYVNFDTKTNPARLNIFNYFAQQPFSRVEGVKPFNNYLQDLACSKFVISPPGAGLDCHRIWEALLVNCIPVIKHSPLDFLLHDLPVLLINDWQEVTEEFLNKKYKEMQSFDYNNEKIFATYWIDQIQKIKAETKANNKTI